MKLLITIGLLTVLISPLSAENWYDKGKSQEQREAISAWFATPVVAGCCKENDAFEVDDFDRVEPVDRIDEYGNSVKWSGLVAIITDGEPNEWRPGLRTGFKIKVPDDKIKLAPPNPSGHGVIFIRRGWDENHPDDIYVYCYFPPASG